jgi:ribosomal protein S6
MIKKKKTNKKTPQKGVRKLNLPTPKVKNTSGYYLCMEDNCHGQNIAKVAKDCKTNAPSLTAKRVKKMKELAKAAKVIGKFANDLERVLPR